MFRLAALTLACVAPALIISADCAAQDLSKVQTRADLEAALSAIKDPALKAALVDHSVAAQAIEQHRHVEAVIRTVESAHGKVEKINATPESLKKATGGEIPFFETLKLVDLQVPNAGPHDQRTFDPYDAAFFEHLGHIAALESLNIISTKLGDDWIDPIAKLVNLKTLRFTNNGKLTDAGLAKLAGLKNLESFSFVGTGMQGHAFASFEGWTHLTKCSFRGSSIDDEGLRHICEKFPNLESISLAHAKFSDAGAVHLAKLTKLKGLELGTHNATPAALRSLSALPLEYLQLGEGFESSEAIAVIKNLKTLKRLTLTNCAKTTDEDVNLVASMKQLESLELDNLPMTEARVAQLEPFRFLTGLRLVQRPQPYAAELQARIRALLPKVQLTFQ